MARILIDDIEYEVSDDDNLLQAALSLGLDLPYFCWHPAMGSIGACRQCAVVQYQNSEDTRGRIVMGCMTPVTDGAIFSLDGDKAKGFRRSIVEALMLNHPHDCPVCAEGGECHLQDMTVMTGHRDRRYRGRKNTHRNQYLGPLVNHEMNRCIACYRCTRYYRDYAGGDDLAAMAAHDHVYFGRHEEGLLESEFAGNLVEVCPTGVFTDKTLANDYTRKWDLQSAPSVCTGCGVGCNTLPGERYGKLKRVHNRFNAAVNGYFLCDRGRFGAGFVNAASRINYPGIRRQDGRYDAIEHHRAIDEFRDAMRDKQVAGVGSPRASLEANHLLRTLVGADNFAPGFSTAEQRLASRAAQLLHHSHARIADVAQMESADAVLVLGEDLTHSAPRVALALRQAVRNRAYEMATELKLLPWQDAAIRNLAQDQRSPLHIAAPYDTRLDDVACECHLRTPEGINTLAAEVGAALSGSSAVNSAAGRIAADLAAAKRPLIIAGTSCGSEAMLDAAAALADQLAAAGKAAMLYLALPECNSLGQALLCEAKSPDLDDLRQRAEAGELETLVILENDLYRRAPKTQVDALLQAVPTVIALDGLDNATVSASTLVLPAASFAEAEGTLVSSAGRAQRHFPVFLPDHERRPAWVWLLALSHELAHPATTALKLFDDVTAHCASHNPALAQITEAAPDHAFRNKGVRVPRQTHRYSGRTAMRANLSVHEPKQPDDDESGLAYTMEGLNREVPGALLPYVWSPGWNSNQSLHRFQEEVGGPLRGGSAGVVVMSPGADTAPVPAATRAVPEGEWQIVYRPRIFGSDELSALSPGITELVEQPVAEISSEDATALAVTDGDGVLVSGTVLEVRVNPVLAKGCVAVSAGHPGTFDLQAGCSCSLGKATQWRRRDADVISSDAGGAHV